MRYILIASALILSACGQGFHTVNDPRSISGVDPAFVPYINLYSSIKGAGFSYDIPIQFSELNGNTVGLCTRWSSGYRQITIDRSFWEDPLTSENEKISLIFHELGHCDLNRGHVSSLRTNGWPVSIMYPYNFEYDPLDESYYFNELFNISTSTESTSDNTLGCVIDID